MQHKVTFLEKFQIWIQSFPSYWQVTITRLKGSVRPTIYSLSEGGHLDSYVS